MPACKYIYMYTSTGCAFATVSGQRIDNCSVLPPSGSGGMLEIIEEDKDRRKGKGRRLCGGGGEGKEFIKFLAALAVLY